MARPRPNRITAHIHAAVERIDSICGRARNDIRARLLEHIDEHPNSPWSYANVARLERTLTEMYQQWGSSVNAVFDDFLPQEYQAGYERAKADLTRSGVWQNITGGPDLRRIQNALDSVYNNVALRTDKMTFDHIRQLRNFSAKVFREAAITGETRKQVSDRLYNEAMQVPGFQFTDISDRRWQHQSYFEMLARTELMNGARDSYEQECAEQGYNIMLLSVSGHCCEACAKYEGQYFSIGPNKYGLPTKDDLEAAGVFHPNCTHSYSAVPDYIFQKEFNIQTGKREHGGYGSRDHSLDQAAKQQQRAQDKIDTRNDILQRNPQLIKQTDAYFDSLSEGDREAIQRYTNSDEYHLSRYLRESKGNKNFKPTKTLEAEIARLDRILENAPKWDGPELFRGMSFDSKKDFDDFINKQILGSKPLNNGFTSTTYDPNAAQKYMQGKHKIMLHIVNPKNGALLADHSAVPGDREVLFPENISFQPFANPKTGRILTEINGVTHIYVTEVQKS